MKNTGIIRRIDELGRIVIPKEIRKQYNIQKNEALEMFVDGDFILLKKFNSFINENKLKELCLFLNKLTNCPVAIANKKDFVAKSKFETNLNLPKFLKSVFSSFNTNVYDPTIYNELNYNNIIAKPIFIDSSPEYAILIFKKEKNNVESDIALINLSSFVCENLF